MGINAALGDQIGNGERALINAEPQNCQQHKDGTRHGIKEELDRRINTARSAPDADQEIHRDEREFPEDIEEE